MAEKTVKWANPAQFSSLNTFFLFLGCTKPISAELSEIWWIRPFSKVLSSKTWFREKRNVKYKAKKFQNFISIYLSIMVGKCREGFRCHVWWSERPEKSLGKIWKCHRIVYSSTLQQTMFDVNYGIGGSGINALPLAVSYRRWKKLGSKSPSGGS